ncbi:hypothetical protein [Streptomyces caeruleatus]|uniref:Uncharacterized protein n=1 Tax=Streptomyces caeruleatus TaxID=661399 RepID=A0A101TLG5_9ACTN|nr:hypothetical protein [Streptomyces caeruleatus]KUN94509.1 hypothetical protein AQJ67_36880 [Streptomyces caeruleatus]
MTDKSPKRLSVRRDEKLSRALRVIGHTDMNDSDATKWALNLAANILELAWVNGHEKLGAIPDVRVYYRTKDSV